jgi:antagonist of KipI
MITVTRAPAWLAVQDLGWTARRAIGLPQGGAIDRHALAVANLVAGNTAGAAALEWALGPGVIRFEAPARFALSGTDTEATLAGEPVPMHTTVTARPGEQLEIGEMKGGRFLYIAIDGGIDVPPVLGARSTYLRGRFGGLHGRLVRTEDYLRVGAPEFPSPPVGFQAPAELRLDYSRHVLRVTPGPQADLFAGEERERLVEGEWVVAAASDRMGYRLKGGEIRAGVTASAASDPTCPGAVQVPDGGGPIVLMADGPTVGGYPKIAVICDADLPLLAQRQPGDRVTFQWITVGEAQRLYRRRQIQLHTLASLVRDAATA